MTKYAWMYRLGLTPWERYGAAGGARLGALLDREARARPAGPGRALDMGRGRGQFTPELARRGWEAVGVDIVPDAVEEADTAGLGWPMNRTSPRWYRFRRAAG